MPTAVGLFSGGLDSILAVRLLQDQGLEIVPVAFVTPFFGADTARRAVSQLGLALREIDITDVHLDMLRAPRHGYGRNMNPCIDCHALMFRQAAQIMRQLGADFLFSGEVLGERRMSQNRNSLRTVARLSGCQDLIVRPLSAQLLPETEPERCGLVDRARLLDIQGRSRRRQLELARHYGLDYFPEPAGGCRLTDQGFSRRLRDLFAHTEGRPARRDLELLSLGRHLRLSSEVRLVVGRNRQENDRIEALATPADVLLASRAVPGPSAVLSNRATEAQVHLAASIVVRYSDTPAGSPGVIELTSGHQRWQHCCQACDEEHIRGCML